MRSGLLFYFFCFSILHATGQGKKIPEFISNDMIHAIADEGNCINCENKVSGIKSKKDRKYSTDYIVLYDPMLKSDAYTICKHVFEKNPNKTFTERYIKIGTKWFAPAVGSQIRFEVINLPLSHNFSLTYDEKDLFNDGAARFESIISNLTSTQIMSPLIEKKAEPQNGILSDSQILANQKIIDFRNNLNRLSTQLTDYISNFKLSSCTINAHNNQLPSIVTNIQSIFDLSFTGWSDFETKLKVKIESDISDPDIKVATITQVESIVKAFKSLENLKPIANTTLKAKNRDYIEIKYKEGNNPESKPENIRMSGGLKIDFSAGFVLTGLRDYSYLLKKQTVNYDPDGSDSTFKPRDTTGNVISLENNGNNQIGVCILTHFYPRISSNYNIGGTVGLMTASNLNLRLMLGGSLLISSLFGSNNRITFSYGIVWGKVNRLSNAYSDYYEKPVMINNKPHFYEESSAPSPIQKSEHSWFFSASYNFGGK